MASKTEGIDLLSMYNDESDSEPEPEPQNQNQQRREDNQEPNDFQKQNTTPNPSVYSLPSNSPTQNLISPSPEIRSLRSPTPPPWPNMQINFASPMVSRPPSERSRIGLMIVDYEHDDTAASPAEEGEMEIDDHGLVDMETEAIEGVTEESIPPEVQLFTPNNGPEHPQPSGLQEQTILEADLAISSTGATPQYERVDVVSDEVRYTDPLANFLPPPVTTKCSRELQEKINKFLAYKKDGKSFNSALRNRKDYRNPDFLQHAVSFQDIDQIGTCFSKDVFDPHGYDISDYYDEIEADMKREVERKELERKKSPKVDFVSAGTQISVAGLSAAVTSGLQSVAVSDGTKQNKKSKWDKVDGDVKNPVLSAVNDNLAGGSLHAAHLSAANAGSGYSAFAQQKRREAEEKRSNERRSDKKS